MGWSVIFCTRDSGVLVGGIFIFKMHMAASGLCMIRRYPLPGSNKVCFGNLVRHTR